MTTSVLNCFKNIVQVSAISLHQSSGKGWESCQFDWSISSSKWSTHWTRLNNRGTSSTSLVITHLSIKTLEGRLGSFIPSLSSTSSASSSTSSSSRDPSSSNSSSTINWSWINNSLWLTRCAVDRFTLRLASSFYFGESETWLTWQREQEELRPID